MNRKAGNFLYRLLLVDDETLELETLRDYVNWKELGVDRIFTASNGMDAYRRLGEYDPDIIITDIKMPVMDGIEFARKVYAEGRKAKIIFLTGYDDFPFVRAAFQVEAVDYLLKPFSVGQISEAVGRVTRELEKDRFNDRSRRRLLQKDLELLLSGESSPEALGAREELAGLVARGFPQEHVEIRGYGSFTAGRVQEIRFAMYDLEYSGSRNGRCDFLFARRADPHDSIGRLKGLLEENGIAGVRWLYDSRPMTVREISARSAFLNSCEPYLYYCPEGGEIDAGVFSKYSFSGTPPERIDGELAEALIAGNKALAVSLLDRWFGGMENERLKKESVAEEVFHLYRYICADFLEQDRTVGTRLPNESAIWNILARAEFFSEVRSLLRQYVSNLADGVAEKKLSKNSVLTARVLKFLDENYARPVTVEEIASALYFSPNYVRNIFKEQTGRTILDYLTEVRMNRAKELLRDRALRVRQVSAMVGYESVSYFCAVFARTFGRSPNDYRNALPGGEYEK